MNSYFYGVPFCFLFKTQVDCDQKEPTRRVCKWIEESQCTYAKGKNDKPLPDCAARCLYRSDDPGGNFGFAVEEKFHEENFRVNGEMREKNRVYNPILDEF